MAENKAKALNQAYKIKLILRDEDRPHYINESSAVVLDITELVKEKVSVGLDSAGDSPASRIVGVQEIRSEDSPNGWFVPLFSWQMGHIQERINDIIRASIVNEKQYEAISRMIGQAFLDEVDRRENLCRDIIKSST